MTLALQLFKNSNDTREKLRLNFHSLSVSEFLEYGRYAWFLKDHSRSRTLKEWKFNLNAPWVSEQILNSWRVSSRIGYHTNPPAIKKLHWHSSEAQIEPPLFECDCEWAFRIQAFDSCNYERNLQLFLLYIAPFGFESPLGRGATLPKRRYL